jgi:signal transduction histidine kinase
MFDAGHLHTETDERRMDGTPVRIEGHYLCVYDEHGRITGHLGIQRDITDRHLAAEEIARSREELRALASRLESIREEERKRIARELHDELGQTLTGLKLDLAWMERRLNRHSQSELVDRCANLLGRLDGVMMAVRRIITELRPSVLDQLGLPDAIEWQAQEFAQRTGLELDLDIRCACEPPSDAVASAVFRMLQEALNNIAKHASATRIRVVLQIEPDLLSLDVGDDGRGITTDELRGAHSLGLLGLRERALALGGTVAIERNASSGTTVALRLPLHGCTGATR